MFQGTVSHHQTNPYWTIPPYYSLWIYINIAPSNRRLATFKGIKHQNYLIGYPLPIDNLFMNPCCAGMFCGRCKIRTYGTFTGPGVFKTPGINQLSQPSKKMQFPSSTESISMPISTLSSMLLMVLYEFLQTQKLASLPTGVCIFF